MSNNFLVYGANGYTGNLILQLCQTRGLHPVIAGRDAGKIESLAQEFGLQARVFGLADEKALDAGLSGITVVLHCAGPFKHTSRGMADACLRNGVHYLDITGELEVFEALAARDAEAKEAGVMLLPGAGFDVVPSDCLALYLKNRLPAATHLTLAFQGLGGISHGTATTMVEKIGNGGAVRREGQIVSVPAAWRTRKIDFGRGAVDCTTIPWGDVATAYYSTGISNIEVYTAMPAAAHWLLWSSRYLGWLLASSPGQSILKGYVNAQPAGPDEAARQRGQTFLYGEVADAQGNRVAAQQSGPEGYTTTALTALAITEKVLAGSCRAGFQTPAKAYGPDLILEIAGVMRKDL